ncbi:uncharacterized protein LOC103861300 [Brassica rapa]|uniref:Uncharacterized protein n=1 Tax=Brassica campestris TaxID=3711 RepID=M4DS90_BRACM|nr:uncharacterized protein LOC103861300 [Brassica rapa]XP_033144983.1 uncharacterized protein LOC103861300 [Brassica rapa]
MEGVGGRLGRSSTRYGGPATVFTGPVRKWKKKWVHVSPSTKKLNHSSSSAASDAANGSHLLFFKWAPLSQTGNGNEDGKSESLSPSEDAVAVTVAAEDPPRRRFKYVPIALLEEQKNEVTEIEEDDKVEEEEQKKEIEQDASAAAEPSEKKAQVEEKPDMNDVPMEAYQEEGKTVRQDLNESTKDSGLNLNANDVDSENNPKGAEPLEER